MRSPYPTIATHPTSTDAERIRTLPRSMNTKNATTRRERKNVGPTIQKAIRINTNEAIQRSATISAERIPVKNAPITHANKNTRNRGRRVSVPEKSDMSTTIYIPTNTDDTALLSGSHASKSAVPEMKSEVNNAIYSPHVAMPVAASADKNTIPNVAIP